MGFNIIKEVLNNKGIKQTWLAEKMGKSYNMVNSYVQNRRQPSIEDLFLIASLLNVEPVDLLSSNESVGNQADLKNANCAIFDVNNLACEYKGKRIVKGDMLHGVEVQVHDGNDWRYLFGAKDLVSAKNAIDKLF